MNFRWNMGLYILLCSLYFLMNAVMIILFFIFVLDTTQQRKSPLDEIYLVSAIISKN